MTRCGSANLPRRLREFATTILTLSVFLVAHPAQGRSLPNWWLKQAMCVHRHESADWHKRTDWLGRPSRDHGGMQIDVSTWAAHAPRGWPADPAAASPAQQLYVAWLIWLGNHRLWGDGQWPVSSRECGLQ